MLLNGIALPDCAAPVPTACCGWNLTCWAMPTGWRRRGLAQWEKVCPGIRARGLPDLAVTALANDFWDEVKWQAKGGSYDFCGSNGCNSSPATIYRTNGGLFQVPTRARGGAVHGLRKFVFGTFLDSSSIPCVAGSKPPPNGPCTALKTVGDAMSAAGLELYRLAIHSAMTTWP